MQDGITRVVIVQQVPHEGPGVVGRMLRRLSADTEVVRAYRGDRIPRSVGPGAALVILGGPMGAYEEGKYPFLTDELRLIESALKAGTPVLGICLGAQLMARAAGARVYRGGAKEIGWYPLHLTEEGRRDSLLLGLPSELRVFQWHGDTFDVPRGGVNLASSELFPHQLVRLGRRAYALQFHLEVTEEMVYEWLDVNVEELRGLEGVIYPDAIRAETPGSIPVLHRYGKAVFSRFFRL